MTCPPFTEPILHVDMDAFFVEVERRRSPALRGRPVVVGGLGNRGVVTSASYEARRLGVHSAMPIARARRLCPQARFVPNDHGLYREASGEVFTVLRSFTPQVEGLSLDEAFLDASGLRLRYRGAAQVGEAIRARLREKLALPASVGAAPNKLLAKLASERAKPDGLLRVPVGQELAFLHPLPVRALKGVGQTTHAALEQLGVHTVGELAAVPLATLAHRLGEAVGSLLHQLAQGRDDRPVVPDQEGKSISVERTYEEDLTGREALRAELLRHCDRLAGRLRSGGLAAGTLHLKVRLADFTTLTRSGGLDTPTDVSRDLYAAAVMLLDRAPIGDQPVRLLGVGTSDLVDASSPRQLSFDRPVRWDEAAEAVEGIRRRFGSQAVGPARLLPPEQR